MKKKLFNLSLIFVGMLIVSIVTATADEVSRIKSLDRMTYTINPQIKLVGPVFRDQSDKTEKTKYVSTLVNLIIKESDKKAHKYLEAGDTKAYYAFLVLGLTVPLHEGLYVHFRNVDGDVCNINANNAELIKKTGATNYKIFNQYFKNPSRPYFPNCEEMPSKVNVNQIIRGGDGTDLSLMQISIRWHFDDFLANRKYESVDETLQYGLNHLLNGFDPVYRNINDYPCLLDATNIQNKKKINYTHLIQGIWAGKYNSGSISQTCRFSDSNSPYKNHDIGFEKNLKKILNFKGSISPDYIGELSLDQATSAAVSEITSNLLNGTNRHSAIDEVLR